MTLRELQLYLECPRKFEIGRLTIGEESRYLCWEVAIRNMCRMLERREPVSKIKKEVLSYFQRNYKMSWFQLPWQKEEAARQDALYFARYLDTFSYELIQGMQSNRLIKISTEHEFEDRYVEHVLLHVHLVIAYKNGEHEAIVFERRFPRRYTCRAKLEAHKPQSSPELTGMLYALRNLPDLRVSQIQLIGDEDRWNQLEAYERKPGANQITMRAGEERWNGRETYEKFIASICMTPKSQCAKCRHESTCKVSRKVYIRKEMTKQEKTSLCFSAEQEAVIERHEGNVRVSAGPGSGKTAVIAARVAYMIRSGIPADKILVMTYTREACKELAGRMKEGKTPVVCTIHSLAYQMLLEYKEVAGRKRLAEQMDKKTLLMRILKHAPKLEGMSYEGMQNRFGLLQTLLKYFNFIEQHGEARFREAYWKKDVDGILRIKEFYDSAFQSGGYITYDDQISDAISLLLENPGILRREQQKHPYIIIDEAQDLDSEQVNLLRLLTGDQGNLMVVGDDDQSIFGFRGGSNEFMLHFQRYYPEAEDGLHSGNDYEYQNRAV